MATCDDPRQGQPQTCSPSKLQAHANCRGPHRNGRKGHLLEDVEQSILRSPQLSKDGKDGKGLRARLRKQGGATVLDTVSPILQYHHNCRRLVLKSLAITLHNEEDFHFKLPGLFIKSLHSTYCKGSEHVVGRRPSIPESRAVRESRESEFGP